MAKSIYRSRIRGIIVVKNFELGMGIQMLLYRHEKTHFRIVYGRCGNVRSDCLPIHQDGFEQHDCYSGSR
jgi:hypothetical protein